MKLRNKEKKGISFSNVFYGILIALTILFTFSVDAKAWLISGLMNIGLFQPDIPSDSSLVTGNNQYNQPDLPEISFKDGQGNQVSLSSLHGKVVFINFWATWCPPCIAEMPTINKLYSKFKNNEGIAFIMVDVDNDYAASKKFMDKHKFALPLYVPVGNIPSTFLTGSIPTTVIINKEGKMMLKHEGAANYANPGVADLLQELINR
jgi:thiol-disulfide isomerase/thioredoxin